MLKKCCLIFILLSMSFTSYAGVMILEDYPVKYFPDKKGVKLDVVKDIIIDAIDRSSYPNHLWTVDSEKSGEIITRLNVRRHVLRMQIKFDEHKIDIQYFDSANLNYSQNTAGLRRIHTKYAEWSGFLLTKIDFVARRTTKMSFVSEPPNMPVMVMHTGAVAKPFTLVFTAYGDVGSRTSDTGIDTVEEMSAAMGSEIERHLKKVKPANVKLVRLNWNKRLYRYAIAQNKQIPVEICKQHNADVILSANLEAHIRGNSGRRDLYYKLYSCKDEDEVKEQYDSYDHFDEKFAYHFDTITNLKKFIRRYKPFE